MSWLSTNQGWKQNGDVFSSKILTYVLQLMIQRSHKSLKVTNICTCFSYTMNETNDQTTDTLP